MKRTCPRRSISTSPGCGSFTFSTISASAKTVSAAATTRAPCDGEFGVGDRAALAGAGLDQDLVAVVDHFPHPGGRDRDPVLVRLDLRGDAYLHVPTSSLARSASQNSIRSWARERSRPVSSSTLRIR